MDFVCKNVAVRGIAATAPTAVLSNEVFADTVENKRSKRQILYTGIKHRHCCVGNQRTSDLASIAAEKLIEKLNWRRDTVSVLVFVTQTPDMYAPSTAMLIQTKLKLGMSCVAFDVNLGCSGFTTGIQIVSNMLSISKGRALLLMGDRQYYEPGKEYDTRQILFGDGGAAVALEYDEGAADIKGSCMTDGSRFKALYAPLSGNADMDGNAIVLFSLNEVVDELKAFCEKFEVAEDSVDYYALHQAQKIIVDGVSQNCGFPREKVLSIYAEYGNTSSASIPFAICGNTEKFSKERLTFLCSGFGIGLAWSNLLLDINRADIEPLILSDYIYPNLF